MHIAYSGGTGPVVQATGLSAHSFSRADEKVTFISGHELWSISATSSSADVLLLRSFEPTVNLQSFLLENETLYIQAALPCRSSPAWFSSDAMDVTGQCTIPQGLLLGELFLALLPTVVLSGCMCSRSSSLFATLFLGIYGMVVVIRLLIDPDSTYLHEFIYTSLIIYSALAYACLALWQFFRSEGWQDLRDWAFAVAAVSFSASLQLRLNLPGQAELWRWVIFALVGLLQMLLGYFLDRRWPRLLGLLELELSVGRLITEVNFTMGVAQTQAVQLAAVALAGGFLLMLAEADCPEVTKVHPQIVQTDEAPPPPVPPVESVEDSLAAAAAKALGQHAQILPEHHRVAFQKTQNIQERLQNQQIEISDAMALEADSDIESVEEV